MSSQSSENSFGDFLSSLSEGSNRKLVQARAEVPLSEESLQVLSADTAWHLLVVPPDELPYCQSYTDVAELVVALQAQIAATDRNGEAGRSRLFVFLGLRAQITRPPFPHLLHPAEDLAFPLYPQRQILEVAKDGYLGDDAFRKMLEDKYSDADEAEDDDGYDDEDYSDGSEPVGLSDEELAAAFTGADEYEDEDLDIADEEPG